MFSEKRSIPKNKKVKTKVKTKSEDKNRQEAKKEDEVVENLKSAEHTSKKKQRFILFVGK